jgi:hypothetical protein
MSKLDILTKLKVNRAECIHDYCQLHFDRDIVLNINNPIQISDPETEFSELTGMIVLAVHENLEQVRLTFSNYVDLIISLEPRHFQGPEALSLYVPGEPTIVWN